MLHSLQLRAVGFRRVTKRDAVVGVCSHAVGQSAREKLVESSALLEMSVQVSKELVVDAKVRHLLKAAGQSVVEEVHEVILERGGFQLDREKVQSEQVLTAHHAEELLEVGDVGADAAAVKVGVGPLDEEPERVGVLVREIHETQYVLESVL